MLELANEINIFERCAPDSVASLSQKRVGIAGLGGLGSNIAIQLVRSGIKQLVLVDFDVVEASNLNRQHYFRKHLGLSKAAALSQQLLEIEPDLKLEIHDCRITSENVVPIFRGVDILVEAFDGADNKAMLIDAWQSSESDAPIVSASGMAGLGPAGLMRQVTLGKRLYIVGDFKTEATVENGLLASRVMLAASMQGLLTIRILLGLED